MMIDNKQYLKKYTDCFLVSGKNGSLIYDLSRSKLISLTDIAARFIKENESSKISDIYKTYGGDIENIVNFLIDQELFFITDEPNSFPEISLDYISRTKCFSAILELSHSNNYNILNIIEELNTLGCNMLFIAVKSNNDFNDELLKNILDLTQDSFLRVIELALPINFRSLFSESFLKDNLRISSITFTGASENFSEIVDPNVRINYIKSSEINWSEQIISSTFSFSRKSFIESNNYNIALNEKVCVDEKGFIRNYINHEKSFGNVDKSKIADVIDSTEFKKKWLVNNDMIEKCKECKYRYCCFSNSDLYVDNGKWYKKTYCNYDLESDEWRS